jgi:O-antigen/teichoic acid export membrane protein
MASAPAAWALASIMVGALALFARGAAPWALLAGSLCAAGAPLAYMLYASRHRKPPREHPLLISIVAGLGCVTAMVAQQRDGQTHPALLIPALGALVVWLLWQRRARRRQTD